MPNSEWYNLVPVGLFSSRIDVTQGDEKIASLTMGWNGKIIITFLDDKEYALKLSGLFQNKLILENEHQEAVIQYEPHYNWRDFYHKYDISYDTNNDKEPKNHLLLLLGLYAANYFIATISGANSGLV